MDSKKYRLYIDESGTHGYSSSEKIKERYLCLLGVIISAEHNQEYISPKWEELRKIITTDIDFPPVFHYTDIISARGDFCKLLEPETRELFNSAYLQILSDGDYIVCCVVLDKKLHIEKYGTSAMHPYHYCLNVLLERYVKFLLSVDATGDVIAEARGKKEDELLRSEFSRFYENGTSFLEASAVQRKLTSHKLKLKTKEARIAGLELADMLAAPMKHLTLKKYGILPELSENFTLQVLNTVFCKVRKSPLNGSTKGYGIKLI